MVRTGAQAWLRDRAHWFLIRGFAARHRGTKILGTMDPAIREFGFNSQMGQDSFIVEEFGHRLAEPGFPNLFLDIGCNHPTKFSNSYYFEMQFGFSCIAVDPLTTYADAWSQLRPRSKFFPLGLSSEPGQMRLLTGGPHSRDDMFSVLISESDKVCDLARTAIVKVETAQNLLDSYGISEVGIMSMDVEGLEMAVLQGIDFDRTTIHLALIENAQNRFGSNQMRRFMKERGFRFYARFWGLDDLYVNEKVHFP